MTSPVYSDPLGTNTVNLGDQLRPKIEHGSVEHARLTNQLLSNFMMKNAQFGNGQFSSPAGIWSGSSPFNAHNNNLKYSGHVSPQSDWHPQIRETESPTSSSHHDSVICSSPISNSPTGQSPSGHYTSEPVYQPREPTIVANQQSNQMQRGSVIRVPILKHLNDLEHASHTPQHYEPVRPKSPIISPISPYAEPIQDEVIYIIPNGTIKQIL